MYHNGHVRGARQFITTKNLIFDPEYLFKHQQDVKNTRIVQREGQLVITTPQIHHQAFGIGYNNANPTNFAYFSWSEIRRIVVGEKD